MKASKMSSFHKDTVNVIVETPRGSQNKFSYDPEFGVFTLTKTLPMGTVFPFEFGFIPQTKGGDGDPLDMLVIMDQPAYPGCHIHCRVLGVLTAMQKEKNGERVRNDRFVGVSNCSIQYGSVKKIEQLNKSMVEEIENFFIDYDKHQGKEFIPINWEDEEHALHLIKKSSSR